MSVRVAIHAEGSRETATFAVRPAPGSEVPTGMEGPAHVLVRRILSEDSKLPPEAVRFVEPLRTGTGLVARGSQLRHRQIVRQLLAGWAPDQKKPDLFVILVDADGEAGREKSLQEWTSDLGACAIGVAVQEFEAWLVSDQAAVQRSLGAEFAAAPDPEGMRPREAKRLLDDAITRSGKPASQVRMALAGLLSLALVAKRCRAFKAFFENLRATRA